MNYFFEQTKIVFDEVAGVAAESAPGMPALQGGMVLQGVASFY